MRELVQLKTQRSIQSLLDQKRHPELDRVVVFDFAQNIPLPHYGGKQPGEMYYLSALTIHMFGIVDLSMTPNKFTCHVYKKSTARKGSNNVASLMMYYFFEKNWLMKNSAGKSLALAMDNCGGQHNNYNVLRIAPHLVKMVYFRSYEFDLYIRGHTNNACDRLSNQMKIRFHKRDAYSYKKLLEILGAQENVTIIDDMEDLFLDYGKFLDEHYNSFKSGTINKKHIFQCDKYCHRTEHEVQDSWRSRGCESVNVKKMC
jgi:hypothetical protein